MKRSLEEPSFWEQAWCRTCALLFISSSALIGMLAMGAADLMGFEEVDWRRFFIGLLPPFFFSSSIIFMPEKFVRRIVQMARGIRSKVGSSS